MHSAVADVLSSAPRGQPFAGPLIEAVDHYLDGAMRFVEENLTEFVDA